MPIAGAAQIGVNDYDDVLWGDVKGDTIEPVNDTYQRTYIETYTGIYWQRISNFFQMEFTGENMYLSGTGNKVVLYNTQTALHNDLYCTARYTGVPSSGSGTAMTPFRRSADITAQLRPVSYRWKKEMATDTENASTTQYGFLAQETEQVLPFAVSSDSTGMKTVDYDALLPVLSGSVQAMHSQMARQQAQASEIRLQGTSKQALSSVADLSIPAVPESGNLLIRYSLPLAVQRAYMLIHTMDNVVLKKITLDCTETSGIHEMKASDLGAGLYMCTIHVDGQPVATKNICITTRR